jgi:hypothetical protein
MTAGSARLKEPPTGVPSTEPFGESTPKSEGGVEGVQEDSSEDRRIKELKATKAQLDEELRLNMLRIAEREKELELKRDREAAQMLEEQRAEGRKRPEEIEQEAMETEEGVLKPGAEERQTRGDEEREEEPLKGERADEHEGSEEGEEKEAEKVKGKRAGEREGLGEEPPREEQEEEMMEEGQAPEAEYQTIELAELLTGPQRKERRERQEVKISEREPLGAERDIQLPDAPPPTPAEMMETEEPASESQDCF